jgi:hypothetical protein
VRQAVTVATIFLLTALMSSISYAGANCPGGTTPAPGGGGICVPAIDPGAGGGTPGGGGGTPGGGGSGGGEIDPLCGELIPMSPQPPAESPFWEGHSPDEGKLYMCSLQGPGSTSIIFVPNADDPPPDPAELARKALEVLKLATPDVHMAPAPPNRTYVGLETWMPPGQWSSLNKSVTAGDTTVTVTAVPKSVLWDMGPSSMTCYSAGREWRSGQMPKGAMTDCSYKYEKISDFEPGKKFKISSTITYQVDWTCDGECLSDEGTLGEVPGPAGGAAISVGERQSVVVSGGKKS